MITLFLGLWLFGMVAYGFQYTKAHGWCFNRYREMTDLLTTGVFAMFVTSVISQITGFHWLHLPFIE